MINGCKRECRLLEGRENNQSGLFQTRCPHAPIREHRPRGSGFLQHKAYQNEFGDQPQSCLDNFHCPYRLDPNNSANAIRPMCPALRMRCPASSLRKVSHEKKKVNTTGNLSFVHFMRDVYFFGHLSDGKISNSALFVNALSFSAELAKYSPFLGCYLL